MHANKNYQYAEIVRITEFYFQDTDLNIMNYRILHCNSFCNNCDHHSSNITSHSGIIREISTLPGGPGLSDKNSVVVSILLIPTGGC